MSLLSLLNTFSSLWEGVGPFLAQGQGGGRPPMVGGVGSLYAAALQTAGVYAQAEVLQRFQPALEKIAAFCFLTSIIGALTCSAVFGQYRKAAYLLVGPPLFYFAITVKTSTDGAHLRFGSREIQGSVTHQIEFLKRWVHDSPYGSSANVSLVFYGWDALVTSIVQGIVSQIEDTENKEDLLLRTRERTFSWLLHGVPDEPAFVKLLAFGNHGRCARLTSLLVDLPNEREEDLGMIPHMPPISSNAGNHTYYTPRGNYLLREYERLRTTSIINLDPDAIRLIQRHPALQKEQIIRNVSCEQIWRWTTMVALDIATRRLTTPNAFFNGGTGDQNIPWQRVIDECRRALSGGADPGGAASRPEHVLAAYLIRNAMIETPLNRMMQAAYSNQPFNPQQERFILETQAGAETYGAYMKILYFATALPYVQGLMLYMLAMLFPFFAILLVMPSRAHSFMLWFSVWAWIKTWDIGFAMIDVARKILWPFVAFGTNRFRESVDFNRPESVYNLIALNDPFAIHNSYLQFVAFLTCTVPFITAHFCMGASNLVEFLKLTVDQNATKFADHRARGKRRELIQTPIEQMLYERMQTAGVIRANSTYQRHQELLRRNQAIAAVGGGAAVLALAQNSEGVADPINRNGALPILGGDGSQDEIMRQGYELGMAEYRQSAEARQLQTMLAVSSSRLSYFNYDLGFNLVTNYVDNFNMRNFQGVGPGQNNMFLGNSGRAPVSQGGVRPALGWLLTPGGD